MRRIVVFLLLLLMATGVAFAEEGVNGEAAAEPGIEPDVTLMEQDVPEPEATEPKEKKHGSGKKSEKK